MESKTFGAGTQYNDWKGTVAADDAEVGMDNIEDLLKKAGKLATGETIIAVEFSSIPNATDIDAYILKADGTTHRVSVDVSADEFVSKFKRFSITISRDGEYDGQNINFTREIK